MWREAQALSPRLLHLWAGTANGVQISWHVPHGPTERQGPPAAKGSGMDPPPSSARDKVMVTGAVMFVTVELCERESSSPRPAPAV